MKKISAFFSLLALVLLSACSAPKYSQDETNNVVMTFNMHAQARAYNSALELLTKPERLAISNPDGTMREDYKNALKRLPPSSLLKESFTLDKYGKIVGMKDVLDRLVETKMEDVISNTGDLSDTPKAEEPANP